MSTMREARFCRDLELSSMRQRNCNSERFWWGCQSKQKLYVGSLGLDAVEDRRSRPEVLELDKGG